MQNYNLKLKIINSVIIGVIATIVFITVITIAADLYLPLEDWLKANFYHHWIGKEILAKAIFIFAALSSLIFIKETNEEKIVKNFNILIWFSILGALAIFAFFVLESLHIWK